MRRLVASAGLGLILALVTPSPVLAGNDDVCGVLGKFNIEAAHATRAFRTLPEGDPEVVEAARTAAKRMKKLQKRAPRDIRPDMKAMRAAFVAVADGASPVDELLSPEYNAAVEAVASYQQEKCQ